jgi:thymidylate synthase (FAD)
MCEIKLHVKMPMFIGEQWLRHRTASINKYSGRYSVMPNEFYYPSHDSFRKQSALNKQGRDEQISEEEYQKTISKMEKLCDSAHKLYQEMIDKNIAREIARTILPANLYTEFYWKIDAHNLMHFLKLRCAPNAQEEIRDYAFVIRDIFSQWMPITHDAFMDYVVNAKTYSGNEIELIQKSLNREDFLKNCEQETYLSDRELKEFRALVEK